MALAREDVQYRLDLIKRSLLLASSMSRPHEALEVLERFVTAANHIGALTAADLARSKLNDLSGDIISVLRQRNTTMKKLKRQLEERLGSPDKPSYPLLPANIKI